jgi:hypothetical protein
VRIIVLLVSYHAYESGPIIPLLSHYDKVALKGIGTHMSTVYRLCQQGWIVDQLEHVTTKQRGLYVALAGVKGIFK